MNRWLSRYPSLLALIPITFLLILLCADVFRAQKSLNQANKTISLVNLVTVTSQLVNELQKEQGISARFIGTNGANFAFEINNQREATDKEIEKLKIFMLDNSYNELTTNTIQLLLSDLKQLWTIREQIDYLNIPLEKALNYYSRNNLIVLNLNRQLTSRLEKTGSSEQFFTLYSTANAKHQTCCVE